MMNGSTTGVGDEFDAADGGISGVESVVGERYVSELRGGARGLSDSGQPRPGGSHGGVWVVVDAHDRSGVRGRLAGGPGGTGEVAAGARQPGGALRVADDRPDRRIATRGQSKNGRVARANGVD